MTTSFQRSDARRFLERLVPPAGQFLEVRTIETDGPAPRQCFCSSIEEALRAVERWSGRANVYVGACPRGRRSGKKSDVDTVLAFWVDLDFHQVDPDRENARATVLARIQTVEIAPTMIVSTGNGIQGWWLLDEPLRISEEWSVARVEAINRGLARRLGGDSVQDISRVLRVPGTINLPDARKRARGCVRVMARLLSANSTTYDPAQFNNLSAEEVRATATATAVSKVEREALSEFACDETETLSAFEALLRRLGPHHRLTRTWEGRRALGDSSRSAFDMALAFQLARLNVRPEVAAVILRRNPAGKGSDATVSYLLRTLSRAYARAGDRRGH